MKRSKFSLSNYKLLTCNQGELVPIGLTEVLPGDTIQQATSALLRVAPTLAPIMHPVHVRIHHWFVPHRLVWDDWEDFITGGSDGLDASTFPTITFSGGTGAAEGSLADYYGITPGVDGLEVSALPFRGYAMIFNEWYRDEDVVPPLAIDTTDGADSTTNTTLQNCAWEKDYFTTSRTTANQGPAVTLPLGTSAPVVTTGETITMTTSTAANQLMRMVPTSNALSGAGSAPVSPENASFGNSSGLRADLSDATAASINSLRLAMAIQRYQEARTRYGSRYVEYLRYLGVTPSDARLQRPEYLGGGKQVIQWSEVLQSAPNATSGTTAEGVGDLKGHGIAALRSNRYRRFFEEHGYIHTFLSVKPKTIYAQGLSRTWNRRTKEDFFQKELQHIGQQEVLNKEVYAAHSTPDGTFGYQDRYDEYRRLESSIAGEFRSTLDHWHMARLFTSDPSLGSTFVTANPTDRIYQSTATDQLYVMANHSIQARRMVAKTGTSFGL